MYCDKTKKKHKLWQYSNSDKTKIVTTLKKRKYKKKEKNLNCDKNSKTWIVTDLRKKSCDKAQQNQIMLNSQAEIVAKLKKLKNSNCDSSNSDSKNNLKPWQPMRCSEGSFSQFFDVLKLSPPPPSKSVQKSH